jgi:hypothetical protein
MGRHKLNQEDRKVKAVTVHITESHYNLIKEFNNDEFEGALSESQLISLIFKKFFSDKYQLDHVTEITCDNCKRTVRVTNSVDLKNYKCCKPHCATYQCSSASSSSDPENSK